MIAFSAEQMPDGTPCLVAVMVGDFESSTINAIHIDFLIYRETLAPGTYTLEHEGQNWSFELPEEFTMQGLPDSKPNVQVELKE